MKHRFTEEQIIKMLREAERGEQTISALCRRMASQNTPSISGDRNTAAWRWPMRVACVSWSVRTPNPNACWLSGC